MIEETLVFYLRSFKLHHGLLQQPEHCVLGSLAVFPFTPVHWQRKRSNPRELIMQVKLMTMNVVVGHKTGVPSALTGQIASRRRLKPVTRIVATLARFD
jgi:hypothetical protein